MVDTMADWHSEVLIVASFWQRYELVDLLIKCGANVNDEGKNGTYLKSF